MVRIRLQRRGRTHRPFYRIGAVDSRTRQPGSLLENLGWYDPMAKDEAKQLHLKEDRIKDWLSRGAIPSDTMMDILAKNELLTADMKARWEKDRAEARDRVACKKAHERVTKAREALREMMESAEGDHAEHLKAINAAMSTSHKSIGRAAVADAEKAASDAEATLAAARKAEESAKPAPEPEPEASEESSDDAAE